MTALWLAAAACGGSQADADIVADAESDSVTVADAAVDSAPDGNHDAITPSPDELCDLLAAAVCGPAAACCTPAAGTDETECRTAFATECRTAGASEIAAVKSGTAFMSAADLGLCLDAYADAGRACRALTASARLGACRNIFQDPASPGTPCQSGLADLRCAGGGGLCFPEPTGTTCRLYGTAGQPCAEAICPPWMHCITTGGALICDAPRDVGGACDADVHCKDGLRCLNQTCAPGIPAGDPCDKSFDCAAGLVCDPLSQQCAPGAVADAPCLSALQCADGLSCQGLTTGKVCIPGEETDGSDAPGLPGFLEPCEDHCAKTFVCGEGPVAGKCAPTLCAALPLRE
ncbi:MAG: hypothetical protein R3F39_08590 [Myxococcota bacterium]